MKYNQGIALFSAKKPVSSRATRVGVTMLLGFVALMNVETGTQHRSLQQESVRKLCSTFFFYKQWGEFWENIYYDETDYNGNGPRAAGVNDPNAVGYFLTLTHCPGDDYATGVDNHDPGHAFYDAAALLKYSILSNTYPKGSKYNATMYAIVHPSAIRCTDPKGEPYDRVAILQELGYYVQILGNPIAPIQLHPTVKEGIDADAGNRSTMPLYMLDFIGHPIPLNYFPVSVDFTTLMLQPMDGMYDTFIESTSDKIAFTRDYRDVLPATGSNSGIDTHWIIFKPGAEFKAQLLDLYLTSAFSGAGWNNDGTKSFYGEYGLKGFLAHYVSRVNAGAAVKLPRYIFGNDNHAPTGLDANGVSRCFDEFDCEDCRDVPMSEVKVIKMITTCGAPWACSFDENWDAKTKAKCEGFHREWFERRVIFEETCWVGAPPLIKRDGDFKTDTFFGYCSCAGPECYETMIHDNPTPEPSATPSSSPSLRPSASPTETPKYPPKVTTNELPGSVGYVSSTVMNPSFETKGTTFPDENKYMIIHQDNLYGWETTAYDEKCEVWHGGVFRDDGQPGRDPDDGEYYVELNANEPAALWQQVDTAGVTSLTIDFAHGQRSRSNEQISVWVGASAPPRKTSRSEVIDWPALGFTQVIETSSSALDGWDQYQATVSLPQGQDATYVSFESLNGASTIGNFLDDAKLSAANSLSLGFFDVQLFEVDDINLATAKITLTNAESNDCLGLGGLLPAGLKSTTTLANGAIEIHVTGSAPLAVYQSIVNGIGFASSSLVAGTRVIEISVNDGELESNIGTISIQYTI